MQAEPPRASAADEEETIRVPASVRFPVELETPPGFEAGDPATWPRVEGRLEYVGGRLLYMPPCGLRQQGVAVSSVRLVATWQLQHREFFVGGNEAGMLLGGDARGAEAAVWRRSDLERIDWRFARVAPILTVEVGGREEGERELRAKAAWYLARGVAVVWIVLPVEREVIVVGPACEARFAPGERLPSHPSLPDLAPEVAEFFDQLD